MWRCGNVGNVGQINISLAQWPHFAGRAYCIHTALHTRPSCEWSSQYSARHLPAHTRSDVFSERVSSLLWREYSDQGPGAVINIRPPLTRGQGTLYRETASNWWEVVMDFLLKQPYADFCLFYFSPVSISWELAGPMGVRGISLVYCCCNLEEMAPLGSQLKIARPGPGALTLQA